MGNGVVGCRREGEGEDEREWSDDGRMSHEREMGRFVCWVRWHMNGWERCE